MKTYIYALIDPRTNEIRYIGKALNTRKRYNSHICGSKSNKTHKDKWINNLLSCEKKPILEVLETCNEENCAEKEQYWIKYYREQGCDLTNLTDGGEGSVNPSEETREKLRNAALRQWSNVSNRKEQSDRLKKIFSNEAYRKEHSNRMKIILSDPKVRKKRSISQKKRLENPENHPHYGKTGELAPMHGKKHTEESKEKNRIAHIGKTQSEESRQKKREANFKRYSDPKEREKASTYSKKAWETRRKNNNGS